MFVNFTLLNTYMYLFILQILLFAMKQLGIDLENEELVASKDYILQNAVNPDVHKSAVSRVRLHCELL